MFDRLSEYNKLISEYGSKKEKLQQKQQLMPLVRLVFFAGAAVLMYFFLRNQSVILISFSLFSFTAFVVLSVIDINLKRAIAKLNILISINQDEVSAIGGTYTMFDTGSEFIDSTHDYTHDLDIFGTGSLFQFLNRTATIFGKMRLASYFTNAFAFSVELAKRQDAVKELADNVSLRQKIQLIFREERIELAERVEIEKWLKSDCPIRNQKLLKILAYGLPCITLSILVVSFFTSISFPIFLIILQLGVVFSYGRKTILMQNSISSKSKILNKYAQCLFLIENSQFTSSLLIDLQKNLKYGKEISASESIRKLSTILRYMDSNLNLLVSVILNGLFMFNLHLLLKVEKWRKSNKQQVSLWFDSIAEFDALSSLANMAFNHPEFVFPEKVDNEFQLEALDLGHPLIFKSKRVVNNIKIDGWNQFAIITGANMSGKSTFLRTVGVNCILAMVGAPVCAKKFRFLPIQIHSSIRTSDSLVKNESYFYAELKRLKQIIDELKQGRKKLILLDEILKGTNSHDKQAGSIALIEQLLHYQSVGMFATHDLLLGELQSRFPLQVKNLCFEIDIIDDKMLIDYKLYPGVCKNLNATYLMKSMGIIMDEK